MTYIPYCDISVTYLLREKSWSLFGHLYIFLVSYTMTYIPYCDLYLIRERGPALCVHITAVRASYQAVVCPCSCIMAYNVVSQDHYQLLQDLRVWWRWASMISAIQKWKMKGVVISLPSRVGGWLLLWKLFFVHMYYLSSIPFNK